MKFTQPVKLLRPYTWVITPNPELYHCTKHISYVDLRVPKTLPLSICYKDAKGMWHSRVKHEVKLEDLWWVHREQEPTRRSVEKDTLAECF